MYSFDENPCQEKSFLDCNFFARGSRLDAHTSQAQISRRILQSLNGTGWNLPQRVFCNEWSVWRTQQEQQQEQKQIPFGNANKEEQARATAEADSLWE